MGGNVSLPERYDPKDWAETPESELNLMPITYPNCGLYAPLAELEKAFPNILFEPMTAQMEYADAICRRYAMNPHFHRKQEEAYQPGWLDKLADDPNSTAIGNLAFMAHHNGPASKWQLYYTQAMEHLRARYVATD